MAYILKQSKQSELTSKEIQWLISKNLLKSNMLGELELVESNFAQRGTNNAKNKDLYTQIVQYLNDKAGSKYRPNVKATQELINGRIREGYSLEDFKKVIDFCCSEWLDNPEMRPYLRPSTLFRPSKFEGYLFQAETYKPVQREVVQPNREPDEVTINYGVLQGW